MVVKNYNKQKIRIVLSNTESVSNNIYRYNKLTKTKEYSNSSSTSSYFLTTKKEVGNELIKLLNCNNSKFICDVNKTKKCIIEQEKILKTLNHNDFAGNLKNFFDSKNYFNNIEENYLVIEYGEISNTDNRYHLHLQNNLSNVKNFRNAIVAVICDLIIEPKGNINIVYPVIKEPTPKALLKEKFLAWLPKNTKLTKSSINKYEISLDDINSDALDELVINKPIYEVLSYQEIDTMRNNIFNSPTFIKKKKIRNNINSAAINHYCQFIKEYYQNNTDQIINDDNINYEDIFLDDEYIDEIIDLLLKKKNIILQGPPGVGKTFIATNILNNQPKFVKPELIQFHQSYSYEDFIQGYRPNDNGTFTRKNGIFYNLTKKALIEDSKNHCIIIDEINRGNLSKIFGELLSLIDPKKRNKKYAVSLTYAKENEEKFYIPDNLYVIGTMNTVDKSLTMFDFAQRRRFQFITIEPAFNHKKFKKYMLEKEKIEESFLNTIITKMNKLNILIEETLGKDSKIGHSYFVGALDPSDLIKSYNQIIKYEIKPLLQEYWSDDEEKLKEALKIVNL